MTPMQAIKSANTVAAKHMDLKDQIGAIRVVYEPMLSGSRRSFEGLEVPA